MNRDAAAFASVASGLLTGYLAIATMVMSRTSDTPAMDAAAVVVGVIAGGLALLSGCFRYERVTEPRAPQQPVARIDGEDQ